MSDSESGSSPTQAEFDALNAKYKKLIERLRKGWLRKHNDRPNRWVLYELDADERTRADRVIRRWGEYITPLSERWWQKRGFRVEWPEKSSQPCKIHKLEAEAA